MRHRLLLKAALKAGFWLRVSHLALISLDPMDVSLAQNGTNPHFKEVSFLPLLSGSRLIAAISSVGAML
jgi:hypothetical protein